MNKKTLTIVGIALVLAAFFVIKNETLVSALLPYATLSVPLNQAGQPINDAALAGRLYKVVDNTATETVVCTAPCVLDGIVFSSGATTNYLVVKDSSPYNLAGATLIPTLYMPGAGKNSSALADVPPVGAAYGLSVKANAADGFQALVLYHMK